MNTNKLIFSQVMDHLPLHTFRRCVSRYHGNRYVKKFRCYEQYLVMAFSQLTHRESLRDIEVCLRAHQNKLYHMGISSSSVSRTTLSKANERRDWRIYADFAQSLIRTARPLYANEDLGIDLVNTVYALDASTIDLCLSVFPWALFRSTKSAVKLHTLPEPGAFYVMDRGYLDFARLFDLNTKGAFFVIRAKSNTKYRRRYSHPTDKSRGIQCDQTVALTGVHSATDYPHPIRRVKYHDIQTGKSFNFLTNNFSISAQTVADLYRYRWQVELFFKWIKQHLRIKSFYGTSENAVKSQIWIAVSVYVLVAIIKKRLDLKADLYTILQVLSLSLFEKLSLKQILIGEDYTPKQPERSIQLNLFDYLTGH
jgi:IS4 transposase